MKWQKSPLLLSSNRQKGQTLIETIVGVFLLVTGLTTALGLAIYALAASNQNFSQIIAANLAREGIEVIRVMRDSNWLAADATGGVYDLASCPQPPMSGLLCYPRVFEGPTFNLNPQNNNVYTTGVTFIPSSRSYAFVADYLLYLQPDGSYLQTPNGDAVFSRKLVVSYNTSGNFSVQHPELIVKSIVGWKGKKCNPMANNDPETTNCKILLEEHLTNWKDYK